MKILAKNWKKDHSYLAAYWFIVVLYKLDVASPDDHDCMLDVIVKINRKSK